MSPKSAEQCG